MSEKDFTYLNVKSSIEHALRVIPPTDRYAKVAFIYSKTEIEFLRREKLIKSDAQAVTAPIEEVIIKFSDLTDVGQDFVMSKATTKWLGACDRKSNDLLSKGASEEERLAVYADARGLEKRLAKFRAGRSKLSN
jgi:hypothetical protein